MKNKESEEMYLETILLLKNKTGFVRAVNVAGELGYAKSSVSRAVKLLTGKGYILVGRDGNISLTDSGFKRASGVYERHVVLTKLLMSLGADRKLAEEQACIMEHVVSDEMFAIIKKHVAQNESECCDDGNEN